MEETLRSHGESIYCVVPCPFGPIGNCVTLASVGVNVNYRHREQVAPTYLCSLSEWAPNCLIKIPTLSRSTLHPSEKLLQTLQPTSTGA